MLVLISYDIADEKRLRKVAILMEDYGTRVQRSVFECLIEERDTPHALKCDGFFCTKPRLLYGYSRILKRAGVGDNGSPCPVRATAMLS